ncbi:Uncharacterized protein APZ42_020259 [Daphnia magna]|uniref:Uncharacterized protein n=1 Tax=Daphnia magna TaxID=35525 RepID=A0A164XMV1_9CRUS|nr:Uncharacterized protein APZ42_020259 [Daphnia magna]
MFIDGHFTPANQVTLEKATSLGMSVILDGGKELKKTDGPVKNDQVCDAFEAAESSNQYQPKRNWCGLTRRRL